MTARKTDREAARKARAEAVARLLEDVKPLAPERTDRSRWVPAGKRPVDPHSLY